MRRVALFIHAGVGNLRKRLFDSMFDVLSDTVVVRQLGKGSFVGETPYVRAGYRILVASQDAILIESKFRGVRIRYI